MFAFGAFFIISVAVAYRYYFQETALENAHQNSQHLAINAASLISSQLEWGAEIVTTLASSPTFLEALTSSDEEFSSLSDGDQKDKIDRLNQRWIETSDPNDPFVQDYMTNTVAHYLKKQKLLFPEIYGEIFLTNRYGIIIATTNKLTTLAHAQKYWWMESYAKGEGKVFLDDRGYDASVEGYVLGIVVPVMHEGQILGILKGNINILGPISAAIEQYNLENHRVFKLVRSKGLIVFEQGQEPLSKHIASPIKNKLGLSKIGSIIFQEDDNELLAAYAPVPMTVDSSQYGFGGSAQSIDHIKGNLGEGWDVVVVSEVEDILGATVETLFWFGIIGGIFILLAGSAAWIMAGRIAKPLIRFSQSAKSIRDGNLDARVDISSTDEIGDLAQSFNAMVSDFQDTLVSRDKLLTELKHRTKQMEVAMRRADSANHAKSAFLANMSHEIRTPMNAILGLTQLMQQTAVTPEQTEQLNKINVASKHLLSVINDILDISKIEVGKVMLEEADVLVKSVFDHVCSMFEEQFVSKDLNLEINLSEGPEWVTGDETRLRQALFNYVGNAIKFTDQGTISLRVITLDENDDGILLRFEVTDTGIGINPDKLTELFRVFEQADVSTTREYGGSGLGLAVTRGLAQLMGGEVGAESELGKGSTFWFTARLGHSKGVTQAEAAESGNGGQLDLEPHHHGTRILLAEDNVINCEVAVALLTNAGLKVETAEDGRQAVDMVQAGDYDLILMDIQMPVMDGLNATRMIRSMTDAKSDVPILAMTANVFDDDRKACLEVGMNDFVGKPIDLENLFSTLVKWLPKQKIR